jgi:hypothetical protein
LPGAKSSQSTKTGCLNIRHPSPFQNVAVGQDQGGRKFQPEEYMEHVED